MTAPIVWRHGDPTPEGWWDGSHVTGAVCPLCADAADEIARDTWVAHSSCVRRVLSAAIAARVIEIADETRTTTTEAVRRPKREKR